MTGFSVTGVVLAGGKGRRMGGVNKGLLSVDGRPMITCVAEAMAPVTEQVYLNVNQLLPAYRALGWPLLSDQQHLDKGPLSGVLCGLQAAHSSHVVIAPCDTPCISSNAFVALYQAAQQQTDKIHYLRTSSGDHPLHAILPCRAEYDLAEFLTGQRFNVLGFYQAFGAQALDWPHDAELYNVNTPQALAELMGN